MIKDLIYMTIGGIICMLCSIRFFIISDFEMAHLSLVFGFGLAVCGIIILTFELINGEKSTAQQNINSTKKQDSHVN